MQSKVRLLRSVGAGLALYPVVRLQGFTGAVKQGVQKLDLCFYYTNLLSGHSENGLKRLRLEVGRLVGDRNSLVEVMEACFK